MSTALGIVAAVLLLFVGVWVAVFGGVGALLAPRRGRSAVNGFLWGALLGPIGWAVVLLRPGSLPRVVRGQVDAQTRATTPPTSHDSEVGYF